MITCWRAEDEAGHLLGGISIEHKGGEFVIGDIAVREDLRGCDIGTLLIQTALKRISEMGGERIYLVAKAPKFFEKFGFTYLTPEEAPDIFNCKTCDQLNVSCHPEFMTYHYEKEENLKNGKAFYLSMHVSVPMRQEQRDCARHT